MATQSKKIKYAPNYTIDTNGKVFRNNKQLVESDNGNGYKKISLFVNGKQIQKYIHRLVAETFIEELGNLQINHKNGIKSDNRLDNLEIVTAKQNTEHALKNGMRKRNIKVLTESEVNDILQLLKLGASTKEIATKFYRSQRCIQYIKKGQHMGVFGFRKRTNT